MRIIISINNKFMEYNPKELINIIKSNSKYIEGFELAVNYYDKKELEFLEELAFQCKKNNYCFQVHGNSTLPIEDQISFLHMIEKISDNLGYKIHVVLHSISSDTKEKSIEITSNYLDNLTKIIDKNKIQIGLENLNDSGGEDRLDKTDITPIVANDESIFLTYDIGHEIIEYGKITDLNIALIPLISNVHIHTINNHYSDGFDHKPIFKNDKYWNEILKSILFLKNNNYDDSVVFEYDLDSCPGNTTLDRIKSYCDSIDYVAERIK